MLIIYKYTLDAWKTEIPMPAFADILTAELQISSLGYQIVIWARVDTEQPDKPRIFYKFATGEEFPSKQAYRFIYINTVQMPAGIVWHVYEELAA